MLTKTNTKAVFVMVLAASLILVALNVMQESEGVSSSYYKLKQTDFIWGYDSGSREVNFSAIGSDISNYTWDFGDGNTGYGKSIKHTYDKDENYTVTLVIRKGGDDIIISQYLNLLDGGTPTVDFYWEPETPTTYDTVYFIDNSTDPDGNGDIYNWTWDFGDGNISYEQNPTHIYTDDGKYDVTLFVKDYSSGGNSATKQIIVFNVPPTANFYWTKENNLIKFIDYSYDTDGSIANWTWDFEDGNISYDQNPVHNYSDYGIYDVTLTIKDDDSAVNSITKKINTLNHIPYVNFFWTPLQPTVLDTVQFDDESSGVDDELVNWTWNFGDGNISYEQNPTHQYSEKKEYTVTLTVLDERYALNTLSKDIEIVNAPPVANFSWMPRYPADGEMINFTDKSSDADGVITNYTWNFGDGNISYERNATHNFSQSGTYNISLTVTDDDEASSNKTCNLTIANVYVDDDAPPDWYDGRHVHTIQEGINNASEGYHVYVLEGNYRESIVIDKSVIIKGENAVVDGMGTGSAVTITAGESKIQNFVITNASNNVGIDVNGNNITIENCISTDNKIGIRLQGDYTKVSDNEVRDNIKGVVIESSDNHVKNNEILQNSNGTDVNGDENEISGNNFADNIFGIEIKNGNNNEINGNDFHENSHAIDVHTYGTCSIKDNRLEGNGNGIRLFSSNTSSVDNNTLKFNTVAILVNGDGNTITNCDITHNINGIEIGSSCNTLIDNCSISSNAYGVYIEDSDFINITNSKFNSHYTSGIYSRISSRVGIFNSSFSENTEGVNIKNSSGVEIKLCNFTGKNCGINITDSKANIEDCIIHESDVGLIVYGDNSTFKSLDIYENDFGFKIYGKNNTVEECTIRDNNYGMYAFDSTYLNIQVSAFKNEYAVYLYNSSACILGNASFSNNTYGAYVDGSGYINVTNCTFSHNEKGVVLTDSLYNTIGNNIINDGTTGLEITNSKHNIFSSNMIGRNSIGLLLSYAPLNTFTDNIFSGNNYGIDMEGSETEHFYEYMDVSNKVNERNVYYLVNQTGGALTSVAGYMALINCVNISIEVSTENNGEGMLVVNSSNIYISESNFSDNIDGMIFILSSGCDIKNVTASGNANDGIIFRLSSDTSITNCDIFSNGQRGMNAYSIGPSNGGFIIKDCRIYLNWLGINIENVHTNTIENTMFYNNERSGMRLFKSDGNSIHNNTLNDNECGIDVISSASTDISGNDLWKNEKGVRLSDSYASITGENRFNNSNTGLLITDSDADIEDCMFYENVNGTASYDSSFDMTNCIFTNNTYGIYSSSYTSKINRCEFSINEYGVFLYQSNDTSIVNCTGSGIHNNVYGVLINSSSYTGMKNCSIFDNIHGLLIENSSNGNTDGCTIYNNTDGIAIANGSISNTITRLLIHHNLYGLDIKSDNNYIFNCSFWKNVYGLNIEKGTGNAIYHNNFAYNVENAFDKGNNNTWDNGYPSGGNYWSDYAGTDNYKGMTQNISGSDGIGDIPYKLSGGNDRDKYPLMNTCEYAAGIPNSPPTALFSYYPTNPFSGDTINFIDHSTDPNGEIDIESWHWNFGDGNTSSEQNPTHEYLHSGTYNISLKVNDGYGEESEYNITMKVLNVPPVANFSYDPPAPTTADTINFTDASTDSDGTIANYTWDFGDGTASDKQNPEHKYHENGIYVVTLTVTDNEGAEMKITKKVTVANALPSAEFFYIPEKASVGEKINFTDVSSDDEEIIAWHWDFGDGTASDKQNPEHIYKESGKYTITLTVKDDDGGEDSITKTVEITSENTPGFEVIVMLLGVLLSMILIGKRHGKV